MSENVCESIDWPVETLKKKLNTHKPEILDVSIAYKTDKPKLSVNNSIEPSKKKIEFDIKFQS